MKDVHRRGAPGRELGSRGVGTVRTGRRPRPGVRPEVAVSWHRCREQYRVDPHLTAAPVAVAEVDHTPNTTWSSPSWVGLACARHTSWRA